MQLLRNQTAKFVKFQALWIYFYDTTVVWLKSNHCSHLILSNYIRVTLTFHFKINVKTFKYNEAVPRCCVESKDKWGIWTWQTIQHTNKSSKWAKKCGSRTHQYRNIKLFYPQIQNKWKFGFGQTEHQF